MTHNDLLEEVKKYVAEQYQEEFCPKDAVACFVVPEFLRPEAREFSIDESDDAIKNSGYNPDNDFPIPNFYGINTNCSPEDIEERLEFVDESFRDMLFRKIDEKGLTDSYCYHKAGLQRQHFNKIKNDQNYRPRKSTVIALAFALELSKSEIEEMLLKSGFALSPSSKFDLIIEYCIEKKIYDIVRVNELLFSFDQELLGSKM